MNLSAHKFNLSSNPMNPLELNFRKTQPYLLLNCIYSFSLAARQLLLLLLWSRPIKSVGTGAFLACPGLNSSMSTDLIGAQVHSPPHVCPGRQHVILHMPYVRCMPYHTVHALFTILVGKGQADRPPAQYEAQQCVALCE